MPTVYIVVCHSGTLPANVVRFFTRRAYSHVCYAPDDTLSQLHTFGRIHTRFFIPGGYISGGVNSEFYQTYPGTRMRVMQAQITQAQQQLLERRLAAFTAQPRRYKYGFANCVYQLFGVARQRPRHFTCSQFVGMLFADILPLPHSPALTRPMDFCTLGLPCVFEGTAAEYRAMLAQRGLNKKEEALP